MSHNNKAFHKHMQKCFVKWKRMTKTGFKIPGGFLAQHRAGKSLISVQSGSLLGCGYTVVSAYTRYYLLSLSAPVLCICYILMFLLSKWTSFWRAPE